MTAQKLDGTATLKAIKAELAERISALKAKGVTPGLGTVLVGDDPGSHWYVGAKHKGCAEIGIEPDQLGGDEVGHGVLPPGVIASSRQASTCSGRMWVGSGIVVPGRPAAALP